MRSDCIRTQASFLPLPREMCNQVYHLALPSERNLPSLLDLLRTIIGTRGKCLHLSSSLRTLNIVSRQFALWT